jgi:hypothetical protein
MRIGSAGREHELSYSVQVEEVKSTIAAEVDKYFMLSLHNVNKMEAKVEDRRSLSRHSTIYIFHLRNTLTAFD